MNLGFKKLTGKLLSTNKMEQRISDLQETLQRYHRVEESAEYKEYTTLKAVVESAAFQAKKKAALVEYKTTDCYRKMEEYKKLCKHKALQKYLQTRDSQMLMDYLAFRQTPDYIKLQDKKVVRQSPDLKIMAKFETSKEYQNYVALDRSPLPAQFEALKTEVLSEQFQTDKAFWSNPLRWKTTEEGKQEARFNALSKTPDILFYLSQNPAEIARMEAYTLTFSDEITWKNLADSAWKAGFVYKNKAMKTVHSYTNEQQANNGGKNTGAINGTMVLATQKEHKQAPAWDEKKGFVLQDFEYTSDVVNTAETFRQKGGLFQIKMRCKGKIHHNVSLLSESKSPIVTLFNYDGKQLRVGQLTTQGVENEVIKGINVGEYYIYSLVWENNSLTWYVNNLPVFSSKNVPREEMFFMLSSFIAANQRPDNGTLEVDWIRVYQKA